jgi:hypothetical protein
VTAVLPSKLLVDSKYDVTLPVVGQWQPHTIPLISTSIKLQKGNLFQLSGLHRATSGETPVYRGRTHKIFLDTLALTKLIDLHRKIGKNLVNT